MGSFFTNFQVQSESTPEVRKALAGFAQARAFVSPAKNGWITVYDEASDEQDHNVLNRVAKGLSKKLNTAVFAFLVHDSDVAMYWLYKGGRLIDEFNARPDYFGVKVDDATKQRLKGNADAILSLCSAGTTREQVEKVIYSSNGPQRSADELIVAFAKLLGVDDARMSLGFRYFEEDDDEILPDVAEFEPVGKTADRRTTENEDGTKWRQPDTDSFDLAVIYMTQCWGPTTAQDMQTKAAKHAMTGEDMLKKAWSEYDRKAREALNHAKLVGVPTSEELLTARDQGPEALATLIARRVPSRLNIAGIFAIILGSERYISALLRDGFDPNSRTFDGTTSLYIAEHHHGKDSKIYNMIKAALN